VPPVTEWLLLLTSLLLIAACGGFVAAEFALLTVDRPTVERAVAAGDARAAGVLAAQRTLSTQLSGAQLGITITNLAIGFLAEPAIAELVTPPLESAGLSAAAARGVSVTLALVLATALTMVFGELVPKNLAIAKPLGTAKAVQGFIRGFTKGTAYVIRCLNGAANAILRRLGVEPQEELASARSPQELASVVSRSAEKGVLASDTAALVRRSLAFGDRRAADVATPRVRMRSMSGSDPVEAVVDLAKATGHSRFPVVGEDLDDVVGLVHVKHAVAVPEDERATTTVGQVMARPVVVPSTIRLEPLLRELRAGGMQMAVVIDEFGGTDGVVTVEDLVEELVGDVIDEHDPRGASTRRHADGSWSLSGLLRPDEVTEAVGVEMPDDDSYDSMGGLMGRELGRIPELGDSVNLPGVVLTVERMEGRRVDLIRLRPALDDEGPQGPSDGFRDEGSSR
jgi:CBS domain containing-hemolysin-like protein